MSLSIGLSTGGQAEVDDTAFAMMATQVKWQLNPDVIAQRMQDEIVLVHMTSNRIYELNQTAAMLWELLGQGRGVEQVRQQMLEAYDVDAFQLEREILATLELLWSEGLVIRDS